MNYGTDCVKCEIMNIKIIYVRICVFVCARLYVCVCVCVGTHTCTCTNTYNLNDE